MIHFDNRPMLVEVEATHNNRPLTYMHNDSEGVSCALTSPHLIYGLTLTTAPSDQQFEIVRTAKSLTKITKLQFRTLHSFVRMWQQEYLLSLYERALNLGKGHDDIKV